MKKTSSEHAEQCAIFQWARLQQGMCPELKLLFSIPNGAKLPYRKNRNGARYSPEAQRLLKEGMTPGVADMLLLAPRRGYHGWVGELKYGTNKPTPEQKEFINAARKQGYHADVYWGAEAVIRALCWYLDIPEPMFV